mmetsp:Transcript_52254/g.97817  ORF Transcript_52254/g.97817 Transcript_52254/m.97817 type:complete len:208 (+) Transcript_52254:1245-1868(+)
MKSCFSVTSRTWPVLLSRTRTACSSSTSTAFRLPLSNTLSCGPKKTCWLVPVLPASTRTRPVDWSRIFTYSCTLRSIASMTLPSNSSSSGPGKMVCSPRKDATFPVTVSIRRTYSYDLRAQALQTPLDLEEDPSMRQVGSGKMRAFPFSIHLLPEDVSLTLTYSSSCSAMAVILAPLRSYGDGNQTAGPLTVALSPVSWSSTMRYSI